MNTQQTMARFEAKYARAQTALDNQVLKDSTPYVPMRSGQLMRSGINGTSLGSGKVIWNSIYARRMYYGTSYHFSKDKHPQASAQWFEKAKAVKKKEWRNCGQGHEGNARAIGLPRACSFINTWAAKTGEMSGADRQAPLSMAMQQLLARYRRSTSRDVCLGCGRSRLRPHNGRNSTKTAGDAGPGHVQKWIQSAEYLDWREPASHFHRNDRVALSGRSIRERL
jgi:hypothetical protein